MSKHPLWNNIPPDFALLERHASIPHKTPEGAYWASLQLINHIFNKIALIDLLSGKSMPKSLMEVLSQLSDILEGSQHPLPEDILLHILKLTKSSAKEIVDSPKKKLLRSHPFLPVYKVTEMDNRCMAWLAKQPGRRTREKLGVKQRVLGVKRNISPDTPENRATKKLLVELKPMISQRLDLANNYDGEDRDYIRLLQKMLYLCTDGLVRSPLNDVSAAHVTQPNNVLLSDRVYNRIWRGIKWLKTYESKIHEIWKSGPNRLAVAAFWIFFARLCQRTNALFFDDLCLVQPGLTFHSFGIQKLQNGGSWQKIKKQRDLNILFFHTHEIFL